VGQSNKLVLYQFVVLCMSANPKPEEPVRILHGKRSVVDSDSGRPQFTKLLEV